MTPTPPQVIRKTLDWFSDDSQSSVINSFTDEDGTTRGDDRDVKVTVLDGKKAGFTG